MKFFIKLSHKLKQLRLRNHLFVSQGLNATWLSQYGLQINTNLENLLTSENSLGQLGDYLEDGLKTYRKFSDTNSGKFAPYKFDGGENLCVFLYAWIMATKPKIVVETGVASGITTNIIMEALGKTGGKLYSIDINPKSIDVYRGGHPWSFVLLESPRKRNLTRFAQTIQPIDLWIHDSDHSYNWQKFEYQLAKKFLSKAGILVSDDIDTSSASGAFTMKNNGQGSAIFDGRKFFGVFRFTDLTPKIH